MPDLRKMSALWEALGYCRIRAILRRRIDDCQGPVHLRRPRSQPRTRTAAGRTPRQGGHGSRAPASPGHFGRIRAAQSPRQRPLPGGSARRSGALDGTTHFLRRGFSGTVHSPTGASGKGIPTGTCPPGSPAQLAQLTGEPRDGPSRTQPSSGTTPDPAGPGWPDRLATPNATSPRRGQPARRRHQAQPDQPDSRIQPHPVARPATPDPAGLSRPARPRQTTPHPARPRQTTPGSARPARPRRTRPDHAREGNRRHRGITPSRAARRDTGGSGRTPGAGRRGVRRSAATRPPSPRGPARCRPRRPRPADPAAAYP